MDKQKLINALKLRQAQKTGNESFVLLVRLDQLEEKIGAIKMPDNSDIKGELQKIKEDLQEDLVIELDIV